MTPENQLMVATFQLCGSRTLQAVSVVARKRAATWEVERAKSGRKKVATTH